MSLNTFIKVLTEAGFDVSRESVLDCLWLASIGRTIEVGDILKPFDPVPVTPPIKPSPASNEGSDGGDTGKKGRRDAPGKQFQGRTQADDDKKGRGKSERGRAIYQRGDVGFGDPTVPATPILLPAARTLEIGLR